MLKRSVTLLTLVGHFASIGHAVNRSLSHLVVPVEGLLHLVYLY